MAEIKKTSNKNSSLTVLDVRGIFTREEAICALEDLMNNDVTHHLLWNFSDADVSRITRQDMNQIIQFAKLDTHLRKAGRSAFLVNNDLSFGLFRMYEILSENNNHPIKHCVFRDMEKAIHWLETG